MQIVFFAFLHHSIKKADYSMFRMNLAGTPPTTVLAGTSFVTTAPAAMMALSPMVTPYRMVLLEPTHTRFPSTMGAGVMAARFSGFML
mgnify:CR=1 FL=1